MPTHSPGTFALREEQGKWTLVVELDSLDGAGALLVRLGQEAPELPIQRFDATTATWREAGRVRLAAPFLPISSRRPKKQSSKGPLAAVVVFGLALVGVFMATEADMSASVVPTGSSQERGALPSVFRKRDFGQFVKMTDEFEGAKKMLRYTLYSQDHQRHVTIACANSSVLLVIIDTGVPDAFDMNTPVEIRAKVDDEEARVFDFTGPRGRTTLIPGATPQDLNANVESVGRTEANNASSLAFLKYLRGHKRFVLKPESAYGIPLTDPPAVYDADGIDDVADEVAATCGQQLG